MTMIEGYFMTLRNCQRVLLENVYVVVYCLSNSTDTSKSSGSRDPGGAPAEDGTATSSSRGSTDAGAIDFRRNNPEESRPPGPVDPNFANTCGDGPAEDGAKPSNEDTYAGAISCWRNIPEETMAPDPDDPHFANTCGDGIAEDGAKPSNDEDKSIMVAMVVAPVNVIVS